MSIPLAVSFDFLSAWDFWIAVGIVAGTYGIFTLGLQLNVGYTGILNFGQAGFMAIGAYAFVILVVSAGFPYLLAMAASMVITVLVGLLVGLPSLRLRSDYLAIATIAFSEVIRIGIQNSDSLTGGNQRTTALERDNDTLFIADWYDASDSLTASIFEPLGFEGVEFIDLPLLAVTWITLIVLAFALTRLVRSPWGRVLRAIREDEDAARALGKNVFAYKLQSLMIAAGLGAIAGWLLALDQESLSSTPTFEPIFTFIGYVILVLGGLTSFAGILIGTIIFWTLLESLRFMDLPLDGGQVAALRFLIVGVVLILLIAFRPQGALGKKEEMVLGD